MRYVPALDGLRALAVLAVVCLHAHAPYLQGGFIGVDVFFVLSGYLITQVLAANPDLSRFYWRRAKRLVPALAFMLAAYLIVAPLVVPNYPHARDAGLAFFYLSDYALAWKGVPNFLMHTWSLAVEEHFYLIWPLVFLTFRPSVRMLAVAYVLATAWRWIQVDASYFFRFDAHAAGLILGCLIAQAPRGRWPAWPALVVLAILTATLQRESWVTQGIGLTLAELAAAAAILGQAPRWLESRSLVYLGKLSYGMYLWHYPLMRLMGHNLPWWQVCALGLVGSVVLAALSYHTIEALARRRKGLRDLDVINVQQARGRANGLVDLHGQAE